MFLSNMYLKSDRKTIEKNTDSETSISTSSDRGCGSEDQRWRRTEDWSREAGQLAQERTKWIQEHNSINKTD